MGSKPQGISGSRAATVLGLNKFQSELELWQRLMEEQYPGFNAEQGYTLPADPDNASLRWGTAFEDAIASLAEENQGSEVVKRESLFYFHTGLEEAHEACPDLTSKVLPWGQYISCHIDGYYVGHRKGNKILHEGKHTSQFFFKDNWGLPGTDKVPAYIQCQVQHQLLCTGAESCIVSVLVFPKRPDEWEKEGWHFHYNLKKQNDYKLHNDDRILEDTIPPIVWATVLDQMGYFHQYPIQADKALHKIMLEKYTAWWQEHIIGKTEPVPTNTDDIKRLFPEPIGTIVANEEIEYLCSEYKEIGKEISKTGRLGKRREDLKVRILDWMRKQDSAIDEDSREKTILRDRAGKRLVSWNGKAFR